MPTAAPTTFAALLDAAVREPGVVSTAYRQFHNYSFGNQLLAWAQCVQRGIQPGPLATFQRWRELGRHVRRGEKAIVLCRPVTLKRAATADDGTEEPTLFTRFIYRPCWFVLAQTEGNSVVEPPMRTWNKDRALTALDINEIPFDAMNGNVLGFARERNIAINPVNPLPWKTRFHELAHVLLGHTAEGVPPDGDSTPRNLREVEAEAVAMLCCAALDLSGVEFARGYIQSWHGTGSAIPERSAQKILKGTDTILKAGIEPSGHRDGA